MKDSVETKKRSLDFSDYQLVTSCFFINSSIFSFSGTIHYNSRQSAVSSWPSLKWSKLSTEQSPQTLVAYSNKGWTKLNHRISRVSQSNVSLRDLIISNISLAFEPRYIIDDELKKDRQTDRRALSFTIKFVETVNITCHLIVFVTKSFTCNLSKPNFNSSFWV